MKEKLMSILKEAKIEDSVAKQISEGVLEAITAHVKGIESARDKEEAEAIALIKENVDKLKKAKADVDKLLSEAKEDFKKRFEEARQGVKKLIEEDYKSHKAELSQKTKLFVESKWKEIEGVVKEQVEREIKEDAVAQRVTKLTESIDKFNETEPKQIVKESKEPTQEVKTLKSNNETLSGDNKRLLKENTELKQSIEKLNKKPLKEVVTESKIGKILATGDDSKTKEPNNSVLNEIVRLATYGSKI